MVPTVNIYPADDHFLDAPNGPADSNNSLRTHNSQLFCRRVRKSEFPPGTGIIGSARPPRAQRTQRKLRGRLWRRHWNKTFVWCWHRVVSPFTWLQRWTPISHWLSRRFRCAGGRASRRVSHELLLWSGEPAGITRAGGCRASRLVPGGRGESGEHVGAEGGRAWWCEPAGIGRAGGSDEPTGVEPAGGCRASGVWQADQCRAGWRVWRAGVCLASRR